MDVTGISAFHGQPTVTNPLSSESLLVGREKKSQNNTETVNTEVVKEKSPSDISTVEVVNHANEADKADLNAQTSGSRLDVIV